MAEHGFGLVGCGMIAEFHTKAIQEIPGSKVVAVFDTVAERAERLAAMAGPGCRAYSDLGQMLEHPGLDVVSICTPSGAHMEPAVQAARAGKHLVVEKPLEITLKRCDAIIQACEAGRYQALRDFPVAVFGSKSAHQGSARYRPLRPGDAGRYLCEVVADPGLLRLGRLARNLEAGRRRRAHEPVDSQCRSALLVHGGS